MPIYTYVRNVDPKNTVNAILLRNATLELRLGTYANITTEEISEIRSTGSFVIEEGIIYPATPASGGVNASAATVILPFEPNTVYKKGQAVFQTGSIYISKSNFTSGEEFKIENWETGSVAGAVLLAEKGTKEGVATLNSETKIPIAQIPKPNAGGYFETTFGNGSATSFTIEHKLNTLTPNVNIINQSTSLEEGCKVEVINANKIKLSATAWETTPPGSAAYRVSVDASSGLVNSSGSALTNFVEKGEIGASSGVAPLNNEGFLPESKLTILVRSGNVGLLNPVYHSGADPTGTVDSTAAVLVTAEAQGSNSKAPTIMLPPGIFKLNLKELNRVFLMGAHSDLTTIIPASGTSPIISAGGTGNLEDQRSYINNVKITSGGLDREYKYPLLQFSLTRNLIFGDDVVFEVAGNTAQCVKLIGAYQLRWHGVQFRTGKWGVPVEFINNIVVPSNGLVPQCDTSLFDMQVDGTVGGIFGVTENDVHGFNFFTKVVQTTYYPTAPSQNTTLNAKAESGATSFTVASITGLENGDTLVIDPGLTTCEVLRIGSSPSGATVTLHSSTPLRFTHASGAEVFRGGIGFSFADGYFNMKFQEFHGEGQQIGVSTGNVHGLHFNAPYKGVGRLVHISKDLTQLRVVAPEMMGTVNLNELVRRSSNNSGANADGQWYCEDPMVPTGASITPNIPADYFPHNTKNWRLIANSSGGSTTERWNVTSASNGNKQWIGLSGGTEKLSTTYSSGSSFQGRLAKEENYTILATDPEYIAITSTASARTIKLPEAKSVPPGKTFVIADESNAAGTNNITVERSGTDTFINATSTTTAVISANGSNRKSYSDGNSKWTFI